MNNRMLVAGMKLREHFPRQPVRIGYISRVTEEGTVLGVWTREYCIPIHRAFAMNACWFIRMLDNGYITIEEKTQ